MFERHVTICLANIWGLDMPYYYSNHKKRWYWDLLFENLPSNINVPDTQKLTLGRGGCEIATNSQKIKDFFREKNISNGSVVCIIADRKGIIAIGKSGENCWLRIRGKFEVVPYAKLGLWNAKVFIAKL